MKNLKSVSIIIRTKNEDKWIGSCLKSIFKQKYNKKKIQIIILDNGSNDGTKNIIKKYKIKYLNYNSEQYYPGAALNEAIKFAKNEIVVFLSAHCIPATEKWLSNLVDSFESETAAVYGKQLPYSFSSPSDKRDLFNQFGLEKRIQKRDTFFHNANSAIKLDLIKKYPFDNKAKHIEDRIWAKNILKKGFKIIYEPKAKVWHYHGLNHSNNLQRSHGVGKILEGIIGKSSVNTANIYNTHNLLTIISHNPKKKTINFIKEIKKLKLILGSQNYLGDICIVSHIKKIKDLILSSKFEHFSFCKKKNLITIKKVKIGLKEYEKKSKKIVDSVLILDTDLIFNDIKIYKKLFEKFFSDANDTVIPVKKDYSMYWRLINENQLIRLDEVDKLKKDKKPLYKSFSEFATVIKPSLVFNEKRMGDDIGCVIVE
jgi:rhamnosyltransferase